MIDIIDRINVRRLTTLTFKYFYPARFHCSYPWAPLYLPQKITGLLILEINELFDLIWWSVSVFIDEIALKFAKNLQGKIDKWPSEGFRADWKVLSQELGILGFRARSFGLLRDILVAKEIIVTRLMIVHSWLKTFHSRGFTFLPGDQIICRIDIFTLPDLVLRCLRI